MVSKITDWFLANKYYVKIALAVGLIWPILSPGTIIILKLAIAFVIGFGALYWVGSILEVTNRHSVFRAFVYSTFTTLFIYAVGSGMQLLLCLNWITMDVYCPEGYNQVASFTTFMLMMSMAFIVLGSLQIWLDP